MRNGIPLIWDLVLVGNPTISEDLDKVIEKRDPGECWPAKSRRRRSDTPHKKRPRKWIVYEGKRRQLALARLVLARQKGRIGNGDACHICWDQPWCCNPDHLKEMSPGEHRAFDSEVRKELLQMRQKCPQGNIRQLIVPVSTITADMPYPDGWPTNEEILAEHPELASELEVVLIEDAFDQIQEAEDTNKEN